MLLRLLLHWGIQQSLLKPPMLRLVPRAKQHNTCLPQNAPDQKLGAALAKGDPSALVFCILMLGLPSRQLNLQRPTHCRRCSP